jgi:hypothetical protein
MRQYTIYQIFTKNGKQLLLLLFLVLTAVQVSAQIKIQGNVYGGGNEGDVKGNTKVTLRAGDLNKVFGGARMADIDGNAFVNIDGEHASDYMLINYVYGGNDISGEVGKKNETSESVALLPSELTKVTENSIDKTWDAFVRISNTTKTRVADGVTKKLEIYIGQLFAGGNGDYDYDFVEGVHKIYQKGKKGNDDYLLATTTSDFNYPDLEKTYLEILGGSIVYAFGGGNNATVTEKTVIHVENPSDVVNSIKVKTQEASGDNPAVWTELLSDDRINEMGYNPGYTYPTSAAFQIGSFFGGNNRAAMAIRPTWNLKSGKIRNLYSGGNMGDMTSLEGLLLEIPATSTLIVDNLYGGCRKADVIPGGNKQNPQQALNLDGYSFPMDKGFSARVLVRGGDINNVYGGNDISGKVYGGNAVGIYTSIRGDLYGGGNGSYPYTDNPDLKDDPTYGDLYYGDSDHPFEEDAENEIANDIASVTALNNYRPNAEQVSLRVAGKPDKKTIIRGSIYLGGNSATLSTTKENPMIELKIGSYVIAENVFLGNNGVKMIEYHEKDDDHSHEGVLRTYKDNANFTKMDLTNPAVFSKYMDGCAMTLMPNVVFDNTTNHDPATYVEYSTSFGSFFCGGNVGSMVESGTTTIDFTHKVIIFNKLVGGCNSAYVEPTAYNAEYHGGVIGSESERLSFVDANQKIRDRLVLNLNGLKIQPKRWRDASKTDLIWNTISASSGEDVSPVIAGSGNETSTDEDLDRRFKGGNIYGGCYNSGLVNGNVKININAPIIDLEGDYAIFDRVLEDEEGEAKLNGHDQFTILQRRSGVIRGQQGMDVLGKALNVFGGGYGVDSEIKGSTTINLNKGYVFQIFGGGEMGAIGVHDGVDASGKYTYSYNPAYSTCINMSGLATLPGVPKGLPGDDPDMAEAEFIYGGSFEGPIAGNTVINLNNGRVFDTFAGSCNADIQGHTETYIGENGFPYIRDDVYGGNDLGGRILGQGDFYNRVRNNLTSVHGYDADKSNKADVLTASAYIEYIKGRVDTIFGGCYGYYDYKDEYFKNYTYSSGWAKKGFTKPRMDNAFVNFRPEISNNEYNKVLKIYGAGQGFPGEQGKDSLQNRSYVLIDIPQDMRTFQQMEVFGAGAYSGLGMGVTPLDLVDHKDNSDNVIKGRPDNASAIIDLMSGRIKDVFGASYKEGVTRRTVVNVPAASTIYVNRIFGGGYGISNDVPCDAIETVVNWDSNNAIAEGYRIDADMDDDGSLKSGGIYGGNNNFRRTLFSKINITSTVKQNNEGYSAKVFGAGYGKDTWAQYTEVNLEEGARVYEAYGGGFGGMVLNKESVAAWAGVYKSLGAGYGDSEFDTGLGNPLVKANPLGSKTNTNVYINKNAIVYGYCYGGGLGADATVSGTTYIGLHGGTVSKDLYAAGTSGAVLDKFGLKSFTATTNAYIEGGSVRNVYGGGWEGSVGKHEGELSASATNDVSGVTNVVIGIRKDQTNLPDGYGFYKGVPAIQRNAYGGGEGGAVYGTTNLTINNGYIGYEYSGGNYLEKIHDETWSDETHPVGSPNYRLEDCGNAYGGGYDDNSNVDYSNVTLWGGQIRNSLYGGGEIATIGRGSTKESGALRTLKQIYFPGSTNVKIYNGQVLHDIYGGGKGFNLLGYGHKADREKRYTDGYVFGQTAVYIYGGEIGTAEGIADGYGNVFGGGNIGYVYSTGFYSTYTVSEKEDHPNGSTGSPNHWYYYDDHGNLTEDCKVVVSPMLQVKPGKTVDGKGEYEYVSTEFLNTLQKSDDTWKNLFTGDKKDDGSIDPNDPVDRGVMIHNAVFAGGNVSSNSDQTYANATTVYGNTTATLYDVYHRDFITVGTEHTGGLYGGGNLSMVDGYRELNITNYGTDFYRLDEKIGLDDYRKLSNRERAYFKLQYECKETITIDNVTYTTSSKPVDEEVYSKWLETHDETTTPKKSDIEAAFTPYGFCSIYAGRLLNTIQRADLCGVFGSRLVLQGAKDRVADVGDATVYTLNRVGELSLNKQKSANNDDTGDDAEHGNYFGIYSVVNRLGNLTSDVRFTDKLILDKAGHTEWANAEGTIVDYESATEEERATLHENTYYSHKANDPTSSNRNKGKSMNQVALASGVFLELTTEASTADHKEYGYITGVVELDLINVKRDQVGGGFVYAKNQHGEMSYNSSITNKVLSTYNQLEGNEACTYKQYSYSSTLNTFETSGNFIHPEKRIIDDCYPTNNAYDPNKLPYSEAHYWYVKGDVYIYDVNVSAYTGSANAYMKEVKIPLTITAASHGKLQLMNVKPNLYAYEALDNGDNTTPHKIGESEEYEKAFVNGESDSYELNDVITWWDWHNLIPKEQGLFRKKTYVNCITCKIDGTEYEAGAYVMDEEAFETFLGSSHTFTDADDKVIYDRNNNPVTVDYIFRSSNNIGHDTGYVLTFDMSSPKMWDDWYSPETGDTYYNVNAQGVVSTNRVQTEQTGYREGPTFKTGTAGVYGKRHYDKGEIITEETYGHYLEYAPENDRDVMERAYVATQSVTYNNKTYNKGMAISTTEYNTLNTTTKDAFGEAFVCINSVKLDDQNYLLLNELVTQKQIDQMTGTNEITGLYPSKADEITDALTPAYIITKEGDYGGQQYLANTNYGAIKAWCSLNQTERNNFTFNYDAFDVLSDPNYLDFYDDVHTKTTAQAYKSPYSDKVDVEYEAVFQAEEYGKKHKDPETGNPITTLTYGDGENDYVSSDANHSRISSSIFENYIKNDQRHYTRVIPTNENLTADGYYTVYIANCNFDYGGIPYGKGQIVEDDGVYANTDTSISGQVDAVKFRTNDEQYYCYEDYTNALGETVQKGALTNPTTLSKDEYGNLTNDQKYFIIQGKEPIGLTTLYVSSESDINDVTKEKIITVVYQYTYYENEDDGGIKQTNELHVVNIHLQLESGVPKIGVLAPPSTVLPGYTVGLRAPTVDPGLYEPIGNGWEIYTNSDDAENHRNGLPFDNGSTPVYWYQNENAWVAFYSKNYLGMTYSNPVAIKVANYHDIDDVMKDKEHHMYVDHPGVVRNSKIYIDNRTCVSDPSKSELDLLKDFIDLSVTGPDGPTADHDKLDDHVKGGADLDFILNSNVSPKAYTNWNSIGDDTQCFEGTLHGDGYTISGLNNSLFGKLCGNVYNLGVTGSFTSAGIADTGVGYVENCWINTTGTPNGAVKAVFGNPTATDGRTQVVNCYYEKDKNYATGLARAMTETEFHNGTVAYNLNGFYLNKRYYDKKQGTSGKAYNYLKDDGRGQLTENMNTGYYPSTYAIYPLPDDDDPTPEEGKYGYVEDRYAYPDFIYAGGTIPESAEIRLRTVTTGTAPNIVTKTYYSPIWPDDYIYFGQTLTYGYDASHPHQECPSRIVRSGDRLSADANSNRVYRAPAYFGNQNMGTFHYNKSAIIAAYAKRTSDLDPLGHKAYPGMTAVDFAGHNDLLLGEERYALGLQQATGLFYPPLLDDEGLLSIANDGVTHNLLVYAPSNTANKATYTVLNDYFKEPKYSDYDLNDNYGNVKTAPTHTIFGHVVQSNLKTTSDHLLVDKEDFNCPISYTMGGSNRMWFQHVPDHYVTNVSGKNKGWESISLPFQVSLVTTQQKGELTHFYQGDNEDGSRNSKGHEYWLRQFDGNLQKKMDNEAVVPGVYTADFNSLPATGSNKDYTNQFLWDYYYSLNNDNEDPTEAGDDANGEDYKVYYKDLRTNPKTYTAYPLQQAGKAYLIGFPGVSYYEFDLSGDWTAANTASPAPAKLEQQTLTFASATGVEIKVSDDEMDAAKAAEARTTDGYAYVPNYMNKKFASAGESFVLDNDGASFVRNAAGATVSAFRPYIIPASAPNPSRGIDPNDVEKIVFGSSSYSDLLPHGDPSNDSSYGTLNAYAKSGKIIVESSLRYTVDVSIYTPAGLLVTTVQVMPNETVETSIYSSGVYIVRADNYQYVKKLIVKGKNK